MGQFDGSQQWPIHEQENASEQHAHAASAYIDAPSGGFSPEVRAAFLRHVTMEDRLFLSRFVRALGFTGKEQASLVREVLTCVLDAFPRFDPDKDEVRPGWPGSRSVRPSSEAQLLHRTLGTPGETGSSSGRAEWLSR